MAAILAFNSAKKYLKSSLQGVFMQILKIRQKKTHL